MIGQECIVGANDLGFKICGDARKSGGETGDGEIAAEEGGGEVDVFEVDGNVVLLCFGSLDALETGAGAEEGRGGGGGD